MRLLFFSVCLLFLFSCSSDQDAKESREFIEKFPSVDLKEYDTIIYNNSIEFILPKDYSIAQSKGDRSVLAYSNLVDEVAVELSITPLSTYQRILDAQGISVKKDSLFIQFSEEQYYRITQLKKEVEEKEDYSSVVNKMDTRYYRIHCMSEGFPFKQSLSLRFYENEGIFYMLQFRSLAFDADALSDKEDAVMLSFRKR